MNFKVVKEHEKFYLAQSPNKYYECFLKSEYRPNKDGFIFKKMNEFEGHDIAPEKVNRDFNPSVKFQSKVGGI